MHPKLHSNAPEVWPSILEQTGHAEQVTAQTQEQLRQLQKEHHIAQDVEKQEEEMSNLRGEVLEEGLEEEELLQGDVLPFANHPEAILYYLAHQEDLDDEQKALLQEWFESMLVALVEKQIEIYEMSIDPYTGDLIIRARDWAGNDIVLRYDTQNKCVKFADGSEVNLTTTQQALIDEILAFSQGEDGSMTPNPNMV